jgi:hypothetical protein
MRANIELNRSREFGDIISDTFAFVKQNFKSLLKPYFVIGGLLLITDILISAWVNANRGDASITTMAGLGELFFDFINHVVLTLVTLSYLAVYRQKDNQPADTIEVWGYFRYYFFRVLFTQIVLLICAAVGFFFCFFPGVYFSVVFSLVTPVMVIENGSFRYSLDRAFKIIKENWWLTFGAIILIVIVTAMIMLIIMLPAMIIYGGTQWLTGEKLDTFAGILQSVMINLCQLLWIIPVITITLVYYSLTEEKEGNSLIDRINSFGRKPSPNQPSSEQY